MKETTTYEQMRFKFKKMVNITIALLYIYIEKKQLLAFENMNKNQPKKKQK